MLKVMMLDLPPPPPPLLSPMITRNSPAIFVNDHSNARKRSRLTCPCTRDTSRGPAPNATSLSPNVINFAATKTFTTGRTICLSVIGSNALIAASPLRKNPTSKITSKDTNYTKRMKNRLDAIFAPRISSRKMTRKDTNKVNISKRKSIPVCDVGESFTQTVI